MSGTDSNPPGVNGGMMKKQNPEHKFTYYVQVESVDKYSKKIEELGGKVTIPTMEVPNVGWWALAIDPEGNQFAILEEMQKWHPVRSDMSRQ